MPYFAHPFSLPEPGGPAAGYWEAARRHQLAIQRCEDCGAWRHPPASRCWSCRSPRSAYEDVSGRGEVLSYTIVHQELLPELRGTAPYNVVVVALPEAPDVHLVSNLLDTPLGELRVGLLVEVVFEDVTEAVTLPRFRRAAG